MNNSNTPRKGIWAVEPIFLYPKDGYYNKKIDGIIELVRELEKRDFQVPGVYVKFHIYGRGALKFKTLYDVKWDERDIHVHYLSPQGTLYKHNCSDLNNVAGFEEMHIRGHSARFYSDGSGQQHWEYLGNNWKADMKRFRGMQFKSEKRAYRISHKYISQDNIALFNKEVKLLLDHIRSYPEANSRDFKNSLTEDMEEYNHTKFTAYPDNYPTLYVQTKSSSFSSDARQILRRFEKGFNELSVKERLVYGLEGRRLCSRNDHIQKYEKNRITRQYGRTATTDFQKLKDDYDGWRWDDVAIVGLRPHYMDNIFVVDYSKKTEYRKECFKNTTYLSDSQVDEAYALAAQTIVPIKEYIDNNLKFEEPVFMIYGDIGVDEMECVYEISDKGRKKKMHYKETPTVTITTTPSQENPNKKPKVEGQKKVLDFTSNFRNASNFCTTNSANSANSFKKNNVFCTIK